MEKENRMNKKQSKLADDLLKMAEDDYYYDQFDKHRMPNISLSNEQSINEIAANTRVLPDLYKLIEQIRFGIIVIIALLFIVVLG